MEGTTQGTKLGNCMLQRAHRSSPSSPSSRTPFCLTMQPYHQEGVAEKRQFHKN